MLFRDFFIKLMSNHGEFFLDFFNENNYVVDKIFENKIYKESEVGDDLNGTNEFTIIAKKN